MESPPTVRFTHYLSVVSRIKNQHWYIILWYEQDIDEATLQFEELKEEDCLTDNSDAAADHEHINRLLIRFILGATTAIVVLIILIKLLDVTI